MIQSKFNSNFRRFRMYERNIKLRNPNLTILKLTHLLKIRRTNTIVSILWSYKFYRCLLRNRTSKFTYTYTHLYMYLYTTIFITKIYLSKQTQNNIEIGQYPIIGRHRFRLKFRYLFLKKYLITLFLFDCMYIIGISYRYLKHLFDCILTSELMLWHLITYYLIFLRLRLAFNNFNR